MTSIDESHGTDLHGSQDHAGERDAGSQDPIAAADPSAGGEPGQPPRLSEDVGEEIADGPRHTELPPGGEAETSDPAGSRGFVDSGASNKDADVEATIVEASHTEDRDLEDRGQAETLVQTPQEDLARTQVRTGEPSGPMGGEEMRVLFENLLAAMEIQATVRVKEDSADQVTLDLLNCPDASLVIGRHGQTVDDLQYLGSLILNHNQRDRKRFMLNVENYRERREETLRRSAVDLARQVAQYSQEAVLDPLPPHERRIIHLALMDVPEVYTYSEGEEPDRRIVISPRNLPSTGANEAPEIESIDDIDAGASPGEVAGVQSDGSDNGHSRHATADEVLEAESSSNQTYAAEDDGSHLGRDVPQDADNSGADAYATAPIGEPGASNAAREDLPLTTPGGAGEGGHTGE